MTLHSKAAIIIPVHNEEPHLQVCLQAACAAARRASLAQQCIVVVVLDRCTDGSAAIAAAFPVHAIDMRAGSVGAARAVGARAAIRLGATWLAFTDADTVVAPDWLLDQQALGTDAVCGTVSVSDWHLHDPKVRIAYETQYTDRDGHRHIHGANLGISAAAYEACGGFQSVALHEDVKLVERLLEHGYCVAWSARPRVATSVRIANRVAGGFAGYVQGIAQTVAENSPIDTMRA